MSDGYLLGIDAGGTKTHALIADQNGRVGGGESGPDNWEVAGLDGAFTAYAQVIDDVLRSLRRRKRDCPG